MTAAHGEGVQVTPGEPGEAAAFAPLIRAEVLHAQRVAGYYQVPCEFDWVAYARAMMDGPERTVLVARCPDRPVGFIALRVRHLGGGSGGGWRRLLRRRSSGRLPLAPLVLGTIDACYVVDDRRRQGVGRALVAAAACWFHDAGVGRVELGVLAEGGARGFWERCGFVPYRLLMSSCPESAARAAGAAVEGPLR